MNATEQRAPELQWPEGYPRTAPAERESYSGNPGNISLTRKESFESIVDATCRTPRSADHVSPR